MNEAITAGLRGVSSPADRRFCVLHLITGLGSGDAETVLKRPVADAVEHSDIEWLVLGLDELAATSAYDGGFPNVINGPETTARIALRAAALARVETSAALPCVAGR